MKSQVQQNWGAFLVLFMLSVFGVYVQFSMSYPNQEQVLKYSVHLAIGWCVLLFSLKIGVDWWLKNATPIFLLVCVWWL